MPHQFQSVNCKKCNKHFCPVCKNNKCLECGEIDIPDNKSKLIRDKMRRHMNRHETNSQQT